MDYNFISVEQFKALEESGALLESGTYDGRSPNTDSSDPEKLSEWRERFQREFDQENTILQTSFIRRLGGNFFF